MSDFYIKGENGERIKSSNINLTAVDVIDAEQIMDNNRHNVRLINEWIRPAKIHDRHAIIVSGGPSLNITELKQVMHDHPNYKIICVKHAFPKLIEAGIRPWGLILIHPGSLYEESAMGKNRLDLIKDIDQSTLVFMLTRCHSSYTHYLLDRNIRIIGFHHFVDEITNVFNINPNDFDNDSYPLVKKVKSSLITLPFSCAAIAALNLCIFLGFRNIHFFGLDGSVSSKEDTKEECFNVTYNAKEWIVPAQCFAIGLELIDIYKYYPKDLNVHIEHHGSGTFLTTLSQTINHIQLGSLEEVINHPINYY